MKWREDPASIRPMLATLADPPLTGAGLVYEPKYDGIRALVHVAPGQAAGGVRIWSRLGNEKTSQFPSIVRALDAFRATLPAPVLIDGEIVVCGSFNFSDSADRSNDENLLIIYNRPLAAKFEEEFQRVRQAAMEADRK